VTLKLAPAFTVLRRTVAGMTAVAVAVVSAGCSSGSSTPHTHPNSSGSTSTTTAPTRATTTSGPVTATQTAVLDAWESAQQTLYGYLQGPWEQDRADLVAGETSTDLWPKLADYFTGTALQSEDEFLVGVKQGQLNGPTTYNLGHPVVSSLTGTAAVVTGCIYDSGTTTSAGKPGPATLDGGAGGGSGTWDLELADGSWKITAFKTTSVSKC
jgi:hypothetical protein